MLLFGVVEGGETVFHLGEGSGVLVVRVNCVQAVQKVTSLGEVSSGLFRATLSNGQILQASQRIDKILYYLESIAVRLP